MQALYRRWFVVCVLLARLGSQVHAAEVASEPAKPTSHGALHLPRHKGRTMKYKTPVSKSTQLAKEMFGSVEKASEHPDQNENVTSHVHSSTEVRGTESNVTVQRDVRKMHPKKDSVIPVEAASNYMKCSDSSCSSMNLAKDRSPLALASLELKNISGAELELDLSWRGQTVLWRGVIVGIVIIMALGCCILYLRVKNSQLEEAKKREEEQRMQANSTISQPMSAALASASKK